MADKTIKSLSIEFDADSTNFNKSVKKINSELNASANLAKELGKNMSFDSADDGIKKLNDLLEVQQAQLKGTKSKVSALEKEYDRLDSLDLGTLENSQQELRDNIKQSQAETRKLRSELTKLDKAGNIDTQEYKDLEDELKKSTQNTKDLQEELKGVNSDLAAISPANLIKLRTNIEKALNAEKDLNDQIKLTNDDINALQTGDYDKLSSKVKDAVKEFTDLDTEATSALKGIDKNSAGAQKSLSDIGDEAEQAGTSLSDIAKGGASEALGTLTEEAGGAVEGLGGIAEGAISAGAALGPMGVVVGGVAASLGAVAVSAKNTREIQSQLVGSVNDTGVAFEDQTGTIKIAAHALGIDYVEAAQSAREMTQDFGDSIQTNGDLMGAMIADQALANTGTFESADAYRAATANNAAFGDGLAQSNDTIGKSVYMMQSYGDRADDIIDTQQEWSDTFAATGQSSTDMFNILNAGMTAGARNTDEMANAWNEFQIRLGDGTAQESVESLGLDWNDLVKEFNDGGTSSQLAFAQVVDGLFGIEDQTKRNAVAAGILGTQGEEFISTLNLQKSETEQLVAQMKGQETIMKAVGYTVEENTGFWTKFADANNLTSVEVANLQQKISEQGLSSVDASTKNAVMISSLESLADKYNFTDQETKNLTDTYKVHSGQLDITEMSQKNFADGLDSMHNLLGISKNATDLLTDSYKRYQTEGLSLTTTEVSGLNSVLAEMNATGKISGAQQQQMSTDMIALGQNSLTSKEGMSALKDMTIQLGNAGLLTGPQVQAMGKNISILGDSSASSKDKTAALKGVIDGVGDAGLINQAKVSGYKQKIDDLASASENGTTSQDGLANKIKAAGKAMQDQFQSVKQLTEGFYDNMGPMGKFLTNQVVGKKNIDAFKTATDGGTKSQTELNQGMKDGTNSFKENFQAIKENTGGHKGLLGAIKNTDSTTKDFAAGEKEASKATKDNSKAMKDGKGAAEENAKGTDKASSSLKNYNGTKVTKKKLENDAKEQKKNYDNATQAVKNYKGTPAGKKKLENDAKEAKKNYDDAKGALKDYNAVGPQNKNLKNDADEQKRKYNDVRDSLKDYNIVAPEYKELKNNANQAKDDIDGATNSSKGWDSFIPKPKIFTSIFKTEHQDDGKGGKSGGKSGASGSARSINNTSRNASQNNTNYNPTINVTVQGTGDSTYDGQNLGRQVAKEMYKMGSVKK